MKAILNKEIGIKEDKNVSLVSIFEMKQKGKPPLQTEKPPK